MTNLTKLSYLFLVFWLLFIHSTLTFAADLTFTPNAPIVEVGKQITLSVSGTSGEVTWTVAKGQIQGTGAQVTYIAPAQVGLDVVTVMDGGGNTELVKVTLMPVETVAQTFSLENANWQIFTNRGWVPALIQSEDQKTLWIGTSGGLEQLEVDSGQRKVFTTLDGLPDNDIGSLLADDKGGLWIGTWGGLAYRDVNQEWQVFNTDNSELPANFVKVLLRDELGGLWMGTWGGGLVYRKTNGEWITFNTDNSPLPDNQVYSLLADNHGGLWIGTAAGGLAHLITATNEWQIFNTNNSGLPHNYVTKMSSDGQGGLWISTGSGGVAHYTAEEQWYLFNTTNSKLPHDTVYTILLEPQGGVWMGTYGGLAYLSVTGEWQIFDSNNSKLPGDRVESLLADSNGGIWIGTTNNYNSNGDLSYLSANGQWRVFNNHNDDLPSNRIQSLFADGSGGIWLGTDNYQSNGGLAYYDSTNDKWQVFNTINSDLPDNDVTVVVGDNQGDLWIGTDHHGIAHYHRPGDWQIFNTDNSILPDNHIQTLSVDHAGNLWIGTPNGLVYYEEVNAQWQVFNTDNAGLPDDNIQVLLVEANDNLWIGTTNGLVYHTVNEEWQVFNTSNSSLPSNVIKTLQFDSHRNLWIGTSDGLANYDQSTNEWAVFNMSNSGLPYPQVVAILPDSGDGLWIGTGWGDEGGGVAHFNSPDQWTLFNTSNSGLPFDHVNHLLADGTGGLWVGTEWGFAHLTFGEKLSLVRRISDETQRSNLLTSQPAAIIIAGGGNDSSNMLWDTTEVIGNYLYRVLNKRGFLNDEIYYLSPKSWADFNGDGLDDRIVDAPKPERPLTPEDVRLALEWAKGLGKLDQPLYLFFVDHGGTEKFQLSKLEYLEVTTLKTWLDDYQTITGNQVMMVIDACHSGQLLESLKAPNRAIISSTSDGLAYFDRTDKRGFSRFFAAGLLKGMNFWEAFGYAGGEQTKLLGDMSKLITASTGSSSEIGQVPRFDDGSDEGKWLKQIYLNGSFAAGDLTLAVESLTTSTTVAAGTSLPLKAKAVLAAGLIKRVWAVIRPPKMNLVMDSNGTPILVLPQLTLAPSSSEKDVWEATWQEAIYNGNYQVTFYAEDNQGNIASSDLPVVITVTGGVEPPPQALVQLNLEKSQYQFGERFTATLTEQLSWGYDLYAAVLLPDGQTFVTLKTLNEFAPLNEPKPWRTRRVQTQPVTWIDMTLPETLPKGQYCLFGILSPEGGEVFETLARGLWVWEKKCFEVVP